VKSILLIIFLAAFDTSLSAARPNILFIYTDDHSYRTLSCYEYAESWARTPNIDGLAAHGVRLTHAYIATWCMPSRTTMLTGLHPYGVQTMRRASPYPAGEPEELYDLLADPDELTNIAREPEHAGLLTKLRAATNAGLKRTGSKMVDSLPPVKD
jgi:arylsulfatase A-like enzyme